MCDLIKVVASIFQLDITLQDMQLDINATTHQTLLSMLLALDDLSSLFFFGAAAFFSSSTTTPERTHQREQERESAAGASDRGEEARATPLCVCCLFTSFLFCFSISIPFVVSLSCSLLSGTFFFSSFFFFVFHHPLSSSLQNSFDRRAVIRRS